LYNYGIILSSILIIVGQTKSIVTIFEEYKTLLLPLPSYGIMVGVVLKLWVDADDGKLVNNIEELVEDNAAGVLLE
jgi:hypothetical protein